MRLIRADFKPEHRPSARMWSASVLLMTIAVAAMAWTWYEGNAAALAERRLQEAIAQRNSASPPLPIEQPPKPYDQSARRMLAERAVPWSQALTTLEATSVIGVTPVSADFGTGENAIRAEVAFVDYGSLLDYLKALNAGEPELQWKLVQSQSQSSLVSSSMAVLVGTWKHR